VFFVSLDFLKVAFEILVRGLEEGKDPPSRDAVYRDPKLTL